MLLITCGQTTIKDWEKITKIVKDSTFRSLYKFPLLFKMELLEDTLLGGVYVRKTTQKPYSKRSLASHENILKWM